MPSRRRRYRGCPVCGIRGGCQDCGQGRSLVLAHGTDRLSLVVDGSFKGSYGGAGLVLLLGDVHGTIVAQRACGFAAENASDAEFQAIIRGARWAPGVVIWTDEQAVARKAMSSSPALDVRYLTPNRRNGQRPKRHGGGFGIAAYELAHTLSVTGRCREDPSATGDEVTIASRKEGLSRGARLRLGAELLLEAAARDPAFDGDFHALAERLGWAKSKRWRDNPNIRAAAERWSGAVDVSAADDSEPPRPLTQAEIIEALQAGARERAAAEPRLLARRGRYR